MVELYISLRSNEVESNCVWYQLCGERGKQVILNPLKTGCMFYNTFHLVTSFSFCVLPGRSYIGEPSNRIDSQLCSKVGQSSHDPIWWTNQFPTPHQSRADSEQLLYRLWDYWGIYMWYSVMVLKVLKCYNKHHYNIYRYIFTTGYQRTLQTIYST